METQMLLDMMIGVHENQFIVRCVIADDNSTMRTILGHSHEELHQQCPDYVWLCASPKKNEKLGPSSPSILLSFLGRQIQPIM
eukprot:3221065-Ditylum_brightwellii.AAC.1